MTPRIETLQGFDRAASAYGATWEAHPLAGLWRARVVARCAAVFPAGGTILDLGCGPGLDAASLGELGFSVTAVDSSPEMVAAARGRGVDARLGDLVSPGVGGPFDGVLSNFGALNCLRDLTPLGATLAGLTRAGAPAVLVTMGPTCPAEVLALLRQGHPREAWARRRRRRAPVGGIELAVRWWSTSAFVAALPDFRLERVEALGWLAPAPGVGGGLGWRARAEAPLAAMPCVREWGDHTLRIFRRR